jgi:LCP family protein required for cell wall assembly
MRTTLKRGLGRMETNGRAPLPPSPLTPVSRYGPRRRGPLRLVGKILLWTLVVLLVAAGALVGGAWLFFVQSVEAVRPHSPEVQEAQKFLAAPLPGQPAVAIVIGYDQRRGVDKAQESRSDTVMLLRVDPEADAVTMLSFPRDLIVDIPGCKGHPPYRGRINEAFTYCGPRGTLETVKNLTGVPINYMITVNFHAFQEIVDRVGGVYLDVDQRYFNDNSGLGPGQTYATIDLHPGYQHLDGSAALDYVRFRHTDSDLYRIVRQQEFVKAFKQQISSGWTLLQLPGIVNTITRNVEVAKGGSEPLDPDEVRGYAQLVYRLPSGNFQQVQVEGLTGYAELSAPEGAISAAVESFLNPDVSAPERAADAATGGKPPKAGAAAPDPATVNVEVLNGNGVAGAADDAAYRLSQRGYPTVVGGNAESFDYFETVVLYDPNQASAKEAAEALAVLFADADVEEAPADAGLTTMARVIVGQTFHGTLTPAPRAVTPRHEPPNVVRDPDHAAGHVQAARRKAGFPLLVPTVREANSALDPVEPTRAYRLGDQRAFRLVYRTGAGEHWGIQQTSWADPPLLDGASVTRTLKGRTYDLYFDGSRLHMVAFHENGASYWVVNTLLDRLSNETMLAVAQGLRPRGA